MAVQADPILDDLNKQLEQLRQNLGGVVQSADDEKAKLDAANKQKAALTNQAAALQKQVSEFKTLNDAVLKEVAATAEELDQSKSTLAGLAATLTKLGAKQQQITDAVTAVDQDIAAAQTVSDGLAGNASTANDVAIAAKAIAEKSAASVTDAMSSQRKLGKTIKDQRDAVGKARAAASDAAKAGKLEEAAYLAGDLKRLSDALATQNFEQQRQTLATNLAAAVKQSGTDQADFQAKDAARTTALAAATMAAANAQSKAQGRAAAIRDKIKQLPAPGAAQPVGSGAAATGSGTAGGTATASMMTKAASDANVPATARRGDLEAYRGDQPANDATMPATPRRGGPVEAYRGDQPANDANVPATPRSADGTNSAEVATTPVAKSAGKPK